MNRYTAFLRGINLGGRRVTNEALRRPFEALGLQNVATFRASGNVIFDASAEVSGLAGRIEAGIAADLGFEATTFLRSAAQLHAIAAHEPFPAEEVAASTGKLQVTFLLGRPSAAAVERVLAYSSDEDRLSIEGAELYWLPSHGISGSSLDLTGIARELGEGTTRTIGTITQIHSKYFAS